MIDLAAGLLVAVLSFLVAFVYSNLGLGGGILFVPIMLSFGIGASFGADQNKVLVPISLTLTIATAAAALVTHRRKGHVDARTAKPLIAGALLGTVLGTAVNVLLFTREAFVLFFTAMILAFGALMVREKLANSGGGEDGDDDARATKRRKTAAAVASVGSGFLSGASGVGGGLVNVPILAVILGRGARKAIGTSSLVIVPVAALGFVLTLLLNAQRGLPWVTEEFLLIPVLFPVVLVGAYVGSSWGLRTLRTRTVTLVFIALLFAVAAKLVVVDVLGPP